MAKGHEEISKLEHRLKTYVESLGPQQCEAFLQSSEFQALRSDVEQVNVSLGTLHSDIVQLQTSCSLLNQRLFLLESRQTTDFEVLQAEQKPPLQSEEHPKLDTESTAGSAKMPLETKASTEDSPDSDEEEKVETTEREGASKTTTTRRNLTIPTTATISIAMGIAFLVCSLLTTVAGNPLLCQTKQGRTLWTIPDAPNCSYKSSPVNEVPTPMILALYKRNEIQYKTLGYHCQKIRQTVKTFVYFFNDERLKEESTETLPVTKAECDRMRRWQLCDEGKLVTKGGLLQTENAVDWEYSRAGAYCCSWKSFSATNCFAYTVYVYKKHRSTEMQSTAGNVAHCQYADAACILKDSSAVVWDINPQEHCEYLKWKSISGESLGQNWISDDRNLALTWESTISDMTLTDCEGKRLQLSQQGMPFRIVKTGPQPPTSLQSRKNLLNPSNRVKRRAQGKILAQDHGLVTTELLALSLQALSDDIARGVRYAYSHAMVGTCQNMRQLYNLLRTFIYANPVMAARTLLNRNDIWARSAGNALEVWPCEELPVGTYSFLPMNKTCTLELPLKFRVGGTTRFGNMDPLSNIVHQYATEVDCALDEEIPFRRGNETWLYTRSDGDVKRPTAELGRLEFYHPEHLNWLPWKATISSNNSI